MYDFAILIGIGQRVRYLSNDTDSQLWRQCSLFPKQLTQRDAVYVLHGYVVQATLFPDLVNLHDIAMVEVGSGSGFSQETFQESSVCLPAGEQNLQCHPALQIRVECLVDNPHATFANAALYLIAPQCASHQIMKCLIFVVCDRIHRYPTPYLMNDKVTVQGLMRPTPFTNPFAANLTRQPETSTLWWRV